VTFLTTDDSTNSDFSDDSIISDDSADSTNSDFSNDSDDSACVLNIFIYFANGIPLRATCTIQQLILRTKIYKIID